MLVEVVFLPPIATDLPSRLCVVIDVLRATSTLVSMFEAGARRVLLSESISGALPYADSLPERPLVCGESGGLPPAGFDYGNSPREFPLGSLRGRDLLMCTSNGTRAMELVAASPVVLSGSLLNGSAVVRTALREAWERGPDISLICSGDILGTKFAIDDAFCAGYLLSLMQRDDPAVSLEELATAAARLYRSYLVEAGAHGSDSPPSPESILRAFWESHNAHVLRRVGLAEDVEYCAQLDISRCVPRLRADDGRLALVCEE